VFPVFEDKAFTKSVSPFLMFDYAAPKEFPPNTGKPKGVGQHPHRGFETVTIAFQGEVEHADSLGNVGVIGSGDVQWMTAARGIIHQEFHSKSWGAKGGTFEMAQIWVNLKKEHKMIPPRYQPISVNDITTSPLYKYHEDKECEKAPLEAGSVRIIAGEFAGVKGPATTFSQVDMWDVTINATESLFEFDTVKGNNVIVFCRRGQFEIQGRSVDPQGVAIMDLGSDATKLVLKATKPNTSILLLAGEVIDEPIAAQGPFVMNSRQEIQQANVDFRSGNFGQ